MQTAQLRAVRDFKISLDTFSRYAVRVAGALHSRGARQIAREIFLDLSDMHRYQPLKLDQPESGPLRPGTVACHWLKPEFVGQPLNEPAPPLGSAALKAAQDQWIANIRAAGFPSSDWHQIDLEPQQGATGWLDSPAFLASWIERFRLEFPRTPCTTFYPVSCPWPAAGADAVFDPAKYRAELQAYIAANPWVRKLAAVTFGVYVAADAKWDALWPVFVRDVLSVAVPFFHAKRMKVFYETTIHRESSEAIPPLAPEWVVDGMVKAALGCRVDGVIGWMWDDETWARVRAM